VAFLSDEWIDDMDRAARSSDALRRACADVTVVIEQNITGDGDREVAYHLLLDRGEVAVRPGRAEAATVRFSQDRPTAAAIASGRASAQQAFMAGRLRIGGDLKALLDHADLLSEVDDAFATVRAVTEEPQHTREPRRA